MRCLNITKALSSSKPKVFTSAGSCATRAQLLADLDNQPALDYYQHLGWQETQLIARRLSLQLLTPNADE